MFRDTVDALILGEIQDRVSEALEKRYGTILVPQYLMEIQKEVDAIVSEWMLCYQVKALIVSGRLRCVKRGPGVYFVS